MKKAGIFAAVIATVLIFMQLYNFKAIGSMENHGFAVISDEIAKWLENGMEEGEEPELTLTEFQPSDILYQRGDKYFLGEDKIEIDRQYPLFTNDGEAILNLTSDNRLVNVFFEAVPTYDWLYVSEGTSFNVDRSQADPDEFMLVQLKNGIYMNVQKLEISGGLGDFVIGDNSLLTFDDSVIRYFEFNEDGTIQYSEFTGLFGARIRIGSMEMSYEAFLDSLRRYEELQKNPLQPEEEVEETTTEMASGEAYVESVEATDSAGNGELSSTETAERSTEELSSEDLEEIASENASEKNPTTESTKAAEAGESESLTVKPLEPETTTIRGSQTTQPTSFEFNRDDDADDDDDDDDGGNRKHNNKKETTESTEETTESSAPESTTETNTQESQTTGPGESPSETHPPNFESTGPSLPGQNNIQPGQNAEAFKLPEVEYTEFEMGVYTISTDVKIIDPTARLVNGIRFVVYRGDSPYMRKLIKEDGHVQISPLPPDTYYSIEGYFDYIDQYGEKQKHVFLEKTKLPNPTLPVSELTAIEVTHKLSENLYMDHVELNDIQIKDLPQEGKLSSMDYISNIYCNIRKKGAIGEGERSLPLDAMDIRALRRGESVDWASGLLLESDTDYIYELNIYDRFNNKFVTSPEVVGGEFHTSKKAPKAQVRVDRSSAVEETIINVSIENADDAAFVGSEPNPYLYVAKVEDPSSPIPVTLKGETESVRQIPLNKKDKTDISITNLAPGYQYVFRVIASYDVLDRNEHNDVMIGEASYTTAKLNTLGNVNFVIRSEDVLDTSAAITTSMRSSVNSRLYPYMDRLVLTLTDAEYTGRTFYTLTLTKEELENYNMETGDVVFSAEKLKELGMVEKGDAAGACPFDAVLKISYKEKDATVSAWEALLTSGNAKLTFSKDNLISKTQYQVTMRGIAAQSYDGVKVEEDVTGRYYTGSFRTLRVPAFVELSNWFTTDTYASLFDVYVNDADGAIVDGKISVRLIQNSNSKVIDIKNYTAAELNQNGTITFSNLQKGLEYRVEFYALEYNETYNDLQMQTFKRLRIKSGAAESDSLVFTTGASIWGSVSLVSVDSTYSKLDDVIGKNLFVVNDAVVEKTLTTGGVETYNAIYTVSDYIPVEAGKYYLRMAVHTGNTNIWYYDENKEYVSSVSGNGYWQIFTPPQDGYMRTMVNPSMLNHALVIEITNVEGQKNLADSFVWTSGAYIDTKDQEITHKSYMHTDYIPVNELERFIRLGARDVSDYTANLIMFYDKNKNLISATSVSGDAICGTYETPAGTAYIRMNCYTGFDQSVYVVKASENLYGENLYASVKNNDQIHMGYYLNENQTRVASTTAWYTDYISIKSNTLYYKYTGHAATLYYDKDYQYIGYDNRNNHTVLTPENAVYVRICGHTDYLDKAVFRQFCPAQDQDQMTVQLQVNLEDAGGILKNLENPKYSILVESVADSVENPTEDDWEKDDFLSQTRDIIDSGDAVLRFNERLTMALNRGRKYRMTLNLYLEQYGQDMELDHETVMTDKRRYIISSGAGYWSIASDYFGDYLAVTDITDKPSVNFGAFYGNLNFQGHRIKRENGRYMFSDLRQGAVIENLVVDSEDHSNENISYTAALVYRNYGTIRNLVMNFKHNTKGNVQLYGGVFYTNAIDGIVENFALVLQEDMVLTRYAGVVGYENYGIVRNGYMAQENDSQIIDFTGEGVSDIHYRGMIGVNRRYGRVQNVYSLVDVVTNGEKNSTGYENIGTIVGLNQGTINGAYTTAHVLFHGAPTEFGPAVGKESNLLKTENVQYIQVTDFPDIKEYYNNSYNIEANLEAVSDQLWHESLLGSNGAFETSLVPAGYYPRVSLPESMHNAQPMIALPTLDPPIQPILTSAAVLEQREDEADIQLNFINPQKLYITDAVISRRDQNGEVYMFSQAVDCQITSQEMGDDEIYRVYATVKNPVFFRSIYYVERFDVRSRPTSPDVTKISDGQTPLYMSFYKDISSLDDWSKYVKQDYAGNFRIVKDLNFSYVSALNMKDYVLDSTKTSFSGHITGAYTDENGETKNRKLIGIDATRYGYMFYDYTGKMDHIDIVGFNADVQVSQSYNGFFRYVNRGVLDNIHLMDASVTSGHRGGALIGYCTNGTITNCSVTDSRVTSWSNNTLYIGGFVGHVENTSIERCFVQNIEIEAKDGVAASGIGGFAGYLYQSTTSYCYAQGTLYTSFPNAGGFAGYFNANGYGSMTGCWTKVDITTTTGFAGGIAGEVYAGSAVSCIAAGDLFSRSAEAPNVNRIFGFNRGTMGAKTQNAAFSGQFFGGSVDPELKTDEDWLVGAGSFTDYDFYVYNLGIEDDVYDLDASEFGDGFSIAAGYLPRLLNTDGSVLEHQTPVLLVDTEMTLVIEELKVNANAADDFKNFFPNETYTLGSGLYEMQYRIDNASDYTIVETKFDGMTIYENMTISNVTKDLYTQDTTGTKIARNYPFVKVDAPYDRYKLDVTLTPKSNVNEDGTMIDPDLTVLLSTSRQMTISITIANARQWNDVMKEYGDVYGNFEIQGNIDPTDTANGLAEGEELITGVRVNRLFSASTTTLYEIRNITHNSKETYDALIDESLSEVRNLKFKNISWTSTTSSSYAGIIGQNRGTVKDITFENITFDIKSNNSGCIGLNNGTVESITLNHIVMKSSRDQVGALVGKSYGVIRDITAKGTVASDGTYSFRVENNGSYLGGIVGWQDTEQGALAVLENIYVDTIKVVNTSNSMYSGIVCGWGNPNIHLAEAPETEKRSYVKNSVIINNGTGTRVGGVTGYSQAKYFDVENCRIQSNGQQVGGICGYGGATSCTVTNTVVYGTGYVGGIGGQGSSSNSCTVRNSVIHSTGDYAGGLAGGGGNATNMSYVINTDVIGVKYVGGAVGEATSNVDYARVINTRVDGTSRVGGLAGRTSNVYIRYNGVVNAEVTAAQDEETHASYAGGLLGDAPKMYYMQRNFVDSTTNVDAVGNYVGGLCGSAAAGYHQYNYTSALVNQKRAAANQPIGSFVGGLYGQMLSSNAEASGSYRILKVEAQYFTGTVTGYNYVGGLFGIYNHGGVSGSQSILDPTIHKDMIMAGDVNSTAVNDANTTVYIRWDGNRKDGESAGNAAYTRVLDVSKVNGVEVKNLSDAPGDISLGTMDTFILPFRVTSSRLGDRQFYELAKDSGGMGWNITSYWNLDGLLSMKGYEVKANLNQDHTGTIVATGSNGQQVNISNSLSVSADVKDGTYRTSVIVPDALGYAASDLIMHYDGIQNTRAGHNSTTKVWENLAGDDKYDLQLSGFQDKSGNFTYTVDAEGVEKGAGWQSNSFRNIDATGGWINGNARDERHENVSISVTFTLKEGRTDWTGLAGWANISNFPALQVAAVNGRIYSRGSHQQDSGSDYLVNDEILHNATVVFDYYTKKQSTYLDGVLIKESTSKTNNWAPEEGQQKLFQVMSTSTGAVTNENVAYSLRGNMYNVKVYDRLLTAEEIRSNYARDLERFGDNTSAGEESQSRTTLKQPTTTTLYDGTVTFKDGKATVPIDVSGLTAGMRYDLQVQIETTSGSGEEAETVVKTGMIHGYTGGRSIEKILSFTYAEGEQMGQPMTVSSNNLYQCTETPYVQLAQDSAASYQWYRSVYPGYVGEAIAGDMAKSPTAALAGRGYYYCVVTRGNVVSYTPIVAVETQAYMPYLRSTTSPYPVTEWQEGYTVTTSTEPIMLKMTMMTTEDAVYQSTDAPAFMKKTLVPYSVEDAWYFGDAGIRTSSVESLKLKPLTVQSGTAQIMEELPSMRAYPSGVDRINVEFDNTFSAMYTVMIQEADGETISTVMNERAYTLQYDYETPLTITVSDGMVSEIHQVDPKELRRTVMVWGDSYYYISEGNVCGPNGIFFEGNYIHLYEGKALSADGTIVNLENGTIETREDLAIQWLETTPLYEFDYEGYHIRTFEGFSLIEGADPSAVIPDSETETDPQEAVKSSEKSSSPRIRMSVREGIDDFHGASQNADEETKSEKHVLMQDFKLVVKDGVLYALDTQDSLSGSFIADDYQNQTFISTVKQDGGLNDLADRLVRPSGVSQDHIAHMTNNLDTDQPWVLIRYESGYVKGFNYITGEEFELNNAAGDMSLIQYVGDFFSSKIDLLFAGVNEEYRELVSLKEQLTVRPLDETLLTGNTGGSLGKGATVSGEKGDSIQNSGQGGTGGSENGTALGDGAGSSGGQSGEKDNDSDGVEKDSDGSGEKLGNGADGSDTGKNTDSSEDKEHGNDPFVVDGKEDVDGSESVDGPDSDDQGGPGTGNGIGKGAGTGVGTSEGSNIVSENGQVSEEAADSKGTEQEKNSEDRDQSEKAKEDVEDVEASETKEQSEAAAEGKDDSGSTPGEGMKDQTGSGISTTDKKKTQYLYVYNVEKQKYELYKTETILTKTDDELLSEQDKIELLAAKGMTVNESKAESKVKYANHQERNGLMILGLIAAAIAGLSGVISLKRRQF